MTPSEAAKFDISHFTFGHRNRLYENLKIKAGKREVEITVSPTGRSVQVFVDGEKV